MIRTGAVSVCNSVMRLWMDVKRMISVEKCKQTKTREQQEKSPTALETLDADFCLL